MREFLRLALFSGWIACSSAPAISEESFLFLPLGSFFLGASELMAGAGAGTGAGTASAKLAEAASAPTLAEAVSAAKLPEVTVEEGLVLLLLLLAPVLAFEELVEVTAAGAMGTVSCLVMLSGLGFLALKAVLASDSERAWMKGSLVGSYLEVNGMSFSVGLVVLGDFKGNKLSYFRVKL